MNLPNAITVGRIALTALDALDTDGCGRIEPDADERNARPAGNRFDGVALGRARKDGVHDH